MEEKSSSNNARQGGYEVDIDDMNVILFVCSLDLGWL